MTNVLDSELKNSISVPHYIFGEGALSHLFSLLQNKKKNKSDYAVYLIDIFFKKHPEPLKALPVSEFDKLFFIDTQSEPTTEYINELTSQVFNLDKPLPYAVIGVGGGATLDVAKALSNLLTNKGNAEDYQGWDLVKVPGIFKIGVPTVSGTGAEASRTCVMINPRTGVKLGMNSEYTVFDQLILDPDLTCTVPSDQYFYSGMDAYIHCMEILNGSHRNSFADELSVKAMELCREIFLDNDMKNNSNREKLMTASYLGGLAVANAYVGVVHPFSAGLSVVLGVHHCLANCISMMGVEEFYPEEFDEFMNMVEKQKVNIPRGLCKNLGEHQYDSLYQAAIVHEKPLSNALGGSFRNILTEEKVKELFLRM